MRKQTLVSFVLILVGVVAVVLIAMPVVRQGVLPSSGTLTQDAEEISKRALAYSGAPYRDDYGNTRVPGYVDNNGDRRLVKVNLIIDLLDDAGNRKERIQYTVDDIAAGERKWFDVDAGSWAGPRKPTITVESIEVGR